MQTCLKIVDPPKDATRVYTTEKYSICLPKLAPIQPRPRLSKCLEFKELWGFLIVTNASVEKEKMTKGSDLSLLLRE